MQEQLPIELARKLVALKAALHRMPAIVVAFSGGVDSSLLLKVATLVSPGRVTAITAISASFPSNERRDAQLLVKSLGAEHIELFTDELAQPSYRANRGDRCYFCRKSLFSAAEVHIQAQTLGTLCYGAIPEDLGEDRPGMRAAHEYKVKAPLIDANLSKLEIRKLAKHFGLTVWNKPSAACLASRFPTGVEVTKEGLARVEACEADLLRLGFLQFRARFHHKMVRIEFDEIGLKRLRQEPTLAQAVERCGFRAGFDEVQIDPRGYRTGAVHEPILVQLDG
jgi:pyridinium-3,5-biscarboxylic acid mononucleotide sulfurtransferase